ncbi:MULTISPECIES: polyamine ABC transporter substrate-binding protein [unclassified Mycolicibacterium]|uniref:polyamine ABC transporter substrate-binding protein n=1 Tax=unclassified Mycolicibacterium TaxID=2636767 RepID=UPI0012DCFC94|nr:MULTISPECIES: ABC transporter substrate-binding protein [unclassified Mycolicibacterium]MUL85933.1 extracellular solute-binding protein [Mycolicibacterium sp. CBMA 329]MUL91701.1 extracellular solute-binding protein [Mycolicibacterium sp. CBMA 331]MUM03200.1 extracellular solute-binding protein [Mycolicibacterium sp. CBMA 334]MUM29538.1 extracellular solute-binding protein [Mycolicibacterium sp. CBMA 295]MUM41996.1 extracellular solute-binding protein [Mycolicibacterium sp. CBMA 247]
MRTTPSPMAMLAMTTSIALLAGCSSTPNAGGADHLTLVTYGSAFQKAQEHAFVQPFEQATGIKVTVESPTDLAKLKVMVQSGKPTWDVYVAGQQDVPAYCGTYFDKLDLGTIKPDDFAPGTVHECGVPVDTYSYVLAYNTEKFRDHPPTSIKDFFDTTKFPGTRALSNDPAEGNLELALLADGVPVKDLYPLDYDRAFSVLDRIKDGAVFWSSGAEQVAAMEQKRADLILVWSGRGYEATKNGAPYAPVWQDNSYHWASLAIVKGSPNREAAQKFIDSAVSQQAQTRWAEAIAYGPANLSATPKLDPAQTNWDSSVPEHRALSWQMDNEWWGKHQDEVIQRWTDWTAG